ncbi:Response regulator receiver domain-containing protein [Maribacter sedimenticola]|uniref:Response regulator receiver domain-containing protein n=1 Tax=Maribacter sedimenticola TaxID=228956 RepID=A0ABY1SI96_9FLAO|nr:response regulator [Maribacter sedimenticola]SNR57198.1 Response regulator receiver domain-containing protein [Maribacter sedimenticola]
MGVFSSCCIIDDDEFFILSSKKTLQQIDFSTNILYYTNGQKALDGLVGLIVENIALPTIIFLDLNMPKRDGWSFLEEFEEFPEDKIKHIQIYITSSFISPSLIEKSKKYKLVKDYIVKPLTENALQKIISSHKVI